MSPFILKYLLIRLFSWYNIMICHVECILARRIVISEKEIASITGKEEKNKNKLCTKRMKSCPQLAAILTIALWWLLGFNKTCNLFCPARFSPVTNLSNIFYNKSNLTTRFSGFPVRIKDWNNHDYKSQKVIVAALISLSTWISIIVKKSL